MCPPTIVALVALLALSFAAPAYALVGDASGDDRVTIADGVQVLRAANGLPSVCDDAGTCDLDGSGTLSVTDGVSALRRAAGLPDSNALVPPAPRALTTPVDVHFGVTATVGLQGFQLEVGYPLAKGGFSGSADGVACFSDGDGFFVVNDRDDGTMVLIQAGAVDLTFPIEITCRFDQNDGAVLTPDDLPVTIVEVVREGAPGDPATLLVTVTVGAHPSCGDGQLRITTEPGGVLDLGWTGIAHGDPLPSGSTESFPLVCAAGSSSCAIDGSATVDAPAGPPLPLSAGGVSVCVLSTFREAVTGTYDCSTGCGEASVALLARVFLVQEAAMPCPPCVGDVIPNDGVKDGTCSGGTTPGAACDVGGSSARFDGAGPDFGKTSQDCLPTGSSVGELTIDLPVSTGTMAVAASVDCLAGGFPAGSCHCPGQVQPNACLPNGVCPASGVCEHGPIDGVCSAQGFRPCRSGTGTEDCDDIFPGAGTCIDQPRPCFGDTIVRTGACGSSLVSIFCAPHTRAAAINTTYGLPGPAALSLPVSVQPAPVGTPSPSETPGACSAAPRAGCRHIADRHESTLLVNDHRDGRDELAWRWRGGEATPPEAFGDPTTLTGHALCAYAATAETPVLVLDATVAGGGFCAGKPCWHPRPGGGYIYRDPTAHTDGLTRIELVPGTTGAARIVVKGRGPQLPLPPLPLASPLTAQLQATTGECWEATYDASDIQKNDPTRYRATSNR